MKPECATGRSTSWMKVTPDTEMAATASLGGSAEPARNTGTATTTTPELPNHRCRAGRRCAARSGKLAAATTKQHTLCTACVTAIQAARDRLPAVQEAVRVFVGIKPVTAQTSKVSATKEPQSPLNLAAETMVTDIDEVLSRVGNYLIRDLVSQPRQRFKTWRRDAEQLVYWDGVDLALQVRAVHARAVSLLGFEPQWQVRPAPCWSCQLPSLGQFIGSETVECSTCGARKTVADYQRYCIELARGN